MFNAKSYSNIFPPSHNFKMQNNSKTFIFKTAVNAIFFLRRGVLVDVNSKNLLVNLSQLLLFSFKNYWVFLI